MVDEYLIENLMYTYFEDIYTGVRITDSDYVIDTDGEVHVSTSIHMFTRSPNRMIPVKLAVVDGDFIISQRQLKSLENGPHTVAGDYDCSNNQLTSLMYAPKQMSKGASFRCDHNKLISLAHAPHHADEFVCYHNLLTTLADAPPCRLLRATENPFTSFKHTPDHIEHVVISYAPDLPLLGLLTVQKKIELRATGTYHHERDIKPIELILNKYTQQGKAGMLKCAAELIKAGYKSHAYL